MERLCKKQIHIYRDEVVLFVQVKKFDLDTFIRKANKIWNNKYDYSKVVYTGTNNKVCIICPEHGEFW